jgi:hypothetical protein
MAFPVAVRFAGSHAVRSGERTEQLAQPARSGRRNREDHHRGLPPTRCTRARTQWPAPPQPLRSPAAVVLPGFRSGRIPAPGRAAALCWNERRCVRCSTLGRPRGREQRAHRRDDQRPATRRHGGTRVRIRRRPRRSRCGCRPRRRAGLNRVALRFLRHRAEPAREPTIDSDQSSAAGRHRRPDSDLQDPPTLRRRPGRHRGGAAGSGRTMPAARPQRR